MMIAATLFSSLLATPAPVDSGTVESHLGVCAHLNGLPPGQFQAIRAAGFGAVRTDLTWGEIESKPGQYQWDKWDKAVAEMRANGIHPVLILFDYNKNYGDEAPRSAEARAAFAKFSGLAAARYRKDGADFEIWNEPNKDAFWKPAANAAEYVALVKSASAAIRAANPSARILGGSATEPMLPFLRQCFQLGMLDMVDAVSIHPYRPERPESLIDTVAQIRSMIAAATPRKITIEATEMGYPVTYPGQDETRRARYITRACLSGMVAGLSRMDIYQWNNEDTEAGTQHGFGLNDAGFQPLPAGKAAAKLFGQLQGFHYAGREATGPDDFVLRFEKGSARRYVVWTARRDPANAAAVSVNPGLAPMDRTPVVKVGTKAVGLSGTPRIVS